MSPWRAAPALVLGLAALGCFEGRPPASDTHPPVLILAVDGLDWNLLLPVMRAGKAPNLTDLARRGTAARLSTFEPTDSPIIWTSVATGKTRDKHGITAFVERIDGEPVPVTSNMRRSRAFWNILGDADRSVGIIGWWVTWPAERIEGWMVSPLSSTASPTWKGSLYAEGRDQTWPPELLAALRATIEAEEAAGAGRLARLYPAPPAPVAPWLEEMRHDFGWTVTSDRLFEAAALHVAARHQPRVLALYQGAVDVGGHRFWGYTFPEGSTPANGLSTAQAEVLGAYLPAAVAEVDACLGRLRAALPSDTDIIVLSDHGMHHRRVTGPGAPGRHPLVEFNTGAHGDAPDGVLIAAGPSFRAAKPPFRPAIEPAALPRLGDSTRPGVLDITPTLLHLQGLAVGEDMDGAPLLDLLVEGLATRPVLRIPTWEKGPPSPGRASPVRTDAEREVLERLRSLGYLDGPS